MNLASFLLLSLLAGAEPSKVPSFRVGGFADVVLRSKTDQGSVDLAEIDLYPTAQLSDRWSALAEISARRKLQSRIAGVQRDKGVAELDLERLYVAWEPADLLRIEAGETHTGIVQWNEREHRSRLLQTPIDVPAIARAPQDDGAWPLRFIGVWASGRVEGPLGLRYGVAVGNGSGATRDSIPIFGRKRSPAALLSLAAEPSRLRGLEVSVAAYAQRIPAAAEALRERDVTLSISYVARGAELRAEWARMNHTGTDSGRRFRSTGYYVLASQRLTGRASPLRPYVLLDRLKLAPGEDYLSEAHDENAWAAGVRCDIGTRFTLKGEFRSQRAPLGNLRQQILGLQLGFSF